MATHHLFLLSDYLLWLNFLLLLHMWQLLHMATFSSITLLATAQYTQHKVKCLTLYLLLL